MLQLTSIKAAGYEQVVVGRDATAGLHAIIAIHSTRLGPALGGIRIRPFRGQKAALEDALRLARAMTLKAAVSGLNLGGGKAVVLADPLRGKSRELLLSLGEMIEALKGRYIGAEDSGITPEDLNIVARRTRHLTGTSKRLGGSGNPSLSTARGVLAAMEVAARVRFGDPSLEGLKVAVQGAGQVGTHLVRLLAARGVRVWVGDVFAPRAQALVERYGARLTSAVRLHRMKADIFSPCAFGAVLHPGTIPEIGAGVVVGAANNQLARERRDAAALVRRGILHAPDYVVNAGGLVHLYVREILKGKSIRPWLRTMKETLEAILFESLATGRPPVVIAERIALSRLT